MKKILVHIRGMHCRSCELIVEEKMRKLPGVRSVRANQSKGIAEIHYAPDQRPTRQEVVNAVREAGYEVGMQERLPWLSRNAGDYQNLATASAMLAVAYFAARGSGLFDLTVNAEKTGLLIALVVGLVAGVSSCMALIGGLVLGISSRYAEAHPEAHAAEKFRPHVYFNIGRIVGFAMLGGFMGLLGTALKLSSNVLGLLTVFVGLVMVVLGLKLVGIFPALGNKTLTLPPSLAKALGLGAEPGAYSGRSAAFAGALTFFLPCGFTQAMQLYAVSSGSFARGALIMALFALGTAPGLLGIGGLASALKGAKARVFFAAAGLAILLLGWFNISNGSNLISFGKVRTDAVRAVEDGSVQEVRMTQEAFGYNPSVLMVRKGVPVRWIITGTAPYSCSVFLVMPRYGISKTLVTGENIVEFTPVEAGEIPFSCSMGMYRGKFIVTDEYGNSGAKAAPGVSQAVAAANAAPIGGGSCAAGGGGCGCGGGNKNLQIPAGSGVKAEASGGVQIIRATYTAVQDINPKSFEVKKGIPVSFQVDVRDSGSGCMSSIMIPELYQQPQFLQGGSVITMNFTPQQAGEYFITCAMGMRRGVIRVVG